MNWIERVAKILRDNVVRTINDTSPTDGDIQIGGPNLLYGTTTEFQTESHSGWGVIKNKFNGAKFVPNMTYRYTYGVYVKGSAYKTRCEIYMYDSTGNLVTSRQGNSVPAETGGTSRVTVNMTDPVLADVSYLTFHTAAFTLDIGKDASDISWAEERLFVGDVLFPHSPAPVATVGGQAAADINMDAYALKNGTSPLTVSGEPVVVQTDTIVKRPAIVAGANLDALLTDGIYPINGTKFVNGPEQFEDGTWGYIRIVTGGGDVLFQDIFSNDANNAHFHRFRSGQSPTFKAWSRVLDSSDVEALNNKIVDLEAQIKGETTA